MAIETEGYQEDLAYIHDVGFGGFALKSAPGLLEILRHHGVTEGLVVDLGCGSGLWSRELASAGYTVLGVDQSAAMLKMARKRVPKGRFVHASFLDVDLPSCNAITSIGECLNYLFDTTNTVEMLVHFFARVHAALRPGGLFIFDVSQPGRSGGSGPRQRNFHGDDWAILLETEEDLAHAVRTRRITSFRQVGKLYRRSFEEHHVNLYRGVELAAALRNLGFRARLVRGYGQFRFGRGVAGIIARKKA